MIFVVWMFGNGTNRVENLTCDPFWVDNFQTGLGLEEYGYGIEDVLVSY